MPCSASGADHQDIVREMYTHGTRVSWGTVSRDCDRPLDAPCPRPEDMPQDAQLYIQGAGSCYGGCHHKSISHEAGMAVVSV
jgi:hypothetical protein